MEKSNESFGECFVSGRIINLDSAKIEDLERFLGETSQNLETANSRLNKLVDEIKE